MTDFDEFDLTFMQTAEPVLGIQQGRTLIRTHPLSQCEGREIPCCIHNPSEHHMREWEMNWRADTRVMERICPHGIGHPDPDHMAYVESLNQGLEWQGLHGCDGCCATFTTPGGRVHPVNPVAGGSDAPAP
jgi:hypothetical protein